MSEDLAARIADAQRRALFAAEVIVNRRLHDFSMRYQTQYANDVAAERKAIEQEIRRIRRRVPAPPAVTDALVAEVAARQGLDSDSVHAVLAGLAALRPDILASTAEAADDDANDDGDDEE